MMRIGFKFSHRLEGRRLGPTLDQVETPNPFVFYRQPSECNRFSMADMELIVVLHRRWHHGTSRPSLVRAPFDPLLVVRY